MKIGMIYLKTFNEMRTSNIHTGIELGKKEKNYIFGCINKSETYIEEKEWFESFNVLVDDNIYYVELSHLDPEDDNVYIYEFDNINDVRDFFHLWYYLYQHPTIGTVTSPSKILEIIKRNKKLEISYNDINILDEMIRQGGRAEKHEIPIYIEIINELLKSKYIEFNPTSLASIMAGNHNEEIVKIILENPNIKKEYNHWIHSKGYNQMK